MEHDDHAGDNPPAESSGRREFVRKTSGIAISVILLDLVPALSMAADPGAGEDPNCTEGGSGNDQNCGQNNPYSGSLDPDQHCNKAAEGGHHDPDNMCGTSAPTEGMANGDATCGKSYESEKWDSDESCNKAESPTGAYSKDIQCDAGKDFLTASGDQDEHCGFVFNGGFKDPDEFCRPASASFGPDTDDNCGNYLASPPGQTDPDGGPA